MIKTESVTLSNSDKLSTLRDLGTMLSAGIPLLESVQALLEDSRGNQKKFLEVLRDDLTQGKHVYFTFSKFPNVFTKVVTSIVKASEEAGTLDVTLKDLKENLKKDIEFSDKVKSALIYPLFIVGVFFAVLLMILIVVVPKISSVFSRMNVVLPLPTKIMIYMSEALLNQTIPVVFGLAVFSFLALFLYKRQKKFLLNLIVKLPVVSILAKDIDLTKFSRNLYLLLNAGIPITSALELTENVVANREVEMGVRHAKEAVAVGHKLSEGFKNNRRIFPSIMIRITEAGERSGSLDKSMSEISDFLDYQVSAKLKTATALLEPIMLVVIGVLVGGMMLSIIAPIYGLIGQVGGR
ncbi:MAG: Type II secretion system F domain protein [Candidatus Levybacteria bacterium GW2011_GWA2_37_36]|nr:MAG: Type II secretion system F domain protein [Parcubacteria group bacterium GW2011_GWC1_36_9]KKQ29724.1 MAG: Type II secretion system F domain protein [Candidatus Levybacteria bacterium GW2011_GWA1_37_16]KKQ31992.1 MAG: Type II secretion system F domain protein [Candidatus Levybacteria bacterium GW2011_GWA2_37_36]KKQ37669.1 MAG: Type II secretion system F domain protein [Candidatus Levybacteria bacterium GW2011_GWC2_37_7]KKQ40963.1 MAG: Type II secretion system F domain protein [Candidatus